MLALRWRLGSLCAAACAPALPAFTTVHARSASTRRKTKPNRKRKLPVVLTQDVEGLGWAGRLVRVNDGYYRNTLYPHQVARYATAEDIANAAEVETERKLKKSADSEYDLKVAEIVRNVTREPLKFQRSAKDEFEISLEHIIKQFRRQMRMEVNPEAIKIAELPRMFGDYRFDVQVDDNTVATASLTVAPN